jgi:hypothetical protein
MSISNRLVTVWDKQHEIRVYQKSSVWLVVGDYMGHPIEVKSGSDSSATAAWREAAMTGCRVLIST